MPVHPLISTADLEARLGEENLRIFDTTIYLRHREDGFGYIPESGRAEWESGHIPGAGFLDVVGELSDPDSKVPFTMPPAQAFADIMANHGVSDDSFVVLYNNGIPMWSTRVWWMLRSIGFDRVVVLNGGLTKWKKESRPMCSDAPGHVRGALTARARPEMWADKADMLAQIEHSSAVCLNALSPEVYSGENNQYGRPGHLPGTFNVFYGHLLDSDSGAFLDAAALKPLFEQSGALSAERVITYCGGGISATMDCLALEVCGQRNVAVYDGSMSEWVKDPELPLTLGAEP